MTDFDFYINEYKGNVIPDNISFDSTVTEATAFVDNMVINPDAMAFPNACKRYSLAICAVADVIYSQSKVKRDISSESVGNHSVSYNSKTEAELQQERKSKAMTYLRGTGLLYGGMH